MASACPRGKPGMTGALHLSPLELAQRGTARLGAARLNGKLKLVEDLGVRFEQEATRCMIGMYKTGHMKSIAPALSSVSE